MSDELEKKITNLEERRQELHNKIADSAAVLAAAEEKISELKARQQTRMRADIRLDIKIADQMLQQSTTAAPNELAKAKTVVNREQKQENNQLITRELTAEDITVDPNEKYH